MRILGITPEEVAGTLGTSFVPDTPDAQRRVSECFASVSRGTDTSGVILELRRKDNGKPIWVQWWSKPEPGGKYTRTMFVDITDRVLLEREKSQLSDQNVYLQEELKSVHNFEEIIGRSPALLQALDKVNRVAKTDATVLITGETGTGKELFARAVHSASRRRDKPLIKLNCAALPPGLVESELFGHEKGAFSGAIERRLGRFELAQGGTIFLDEVGEMPAEVQVKLLRVLQEREFERVGGSQPIKIDVRVIAATNRDLSRAIREGKFREDLFYRLNVFPIELPPLRDRIGDVPLLVQFLVAAFSSRVGVRIESISPATMQRLATYPWPGNIRELENVLERAIILANGPTLQIDSAVFGTRQESGAPGSERVVQTAHAAISPIAPGEIESGALGSLEENERSHILACARSNRLGHRRGAWGSDNPRDTPQHPAQPNEEARHHSTATWPPDCSISFWVLRRQAPPGSGFSHEASRLSRHFVVTIAGSRGDRATRLPWRKKSTRRSDSLYAVGIGPASQLGIAIAISGSVETRVSHAHDRTDRSA